MATLIFKLLLLAFVGYELVNGYLRTISLGQRWPDKDEIETCGNIRDIIRRNSGRFRKILVRNTNGDIVFQNDDCRRMTARAKSKLDVLASRVRGQWSNLRLKVKLAWTDQILPNAPISLHYEGRALRLQTSDGDSRKLATLASLAVHAGFDWVKYATNTYIHASVIRDVCQTSVDLAFILDCSGSVGSYNFQQVKNFVKDVVDFFNIGTSGTHVAVVTYSTYTRLEFNLKAHYTKSAMKNAVGNIYYRGGWTYTADALDFVRRNIFVTSQGMRPDQGIPKVAVLLTDGYSNGRAVAGPASQLRNIGVNIFSIGVGHYVNPSELNTIATDPDSTHVFRMNSFNDLAGWVDKLSAVSCDEGASVSSCDDTITTVESDTFKYFRTQFDSVSNNRISVEVRDIEGISHLYASLTSTNPGPMDPQSQKNESNVSPRAISLSLSGTRLVYVAVQGQKQSNKFKLSMWDDLFTRDTYVTSVMEEQNPPLTVLDQKLSTSSYSLRYSITEGNQNNIFDIDSITGKILTRQKLDRETKDSYRLTILGQDINNRCHKGRAVVIVNVDDINDHAPKFGKSQYSATILERKPANTLVTTVTATDKDSGTNAQLSYSITSGNQGSRFKINNRGEVRITQELNFEQQQSYTLGITVQDGGSPSKKASATLSVVVQDVNEHPKFVKPCARNDTCKFSVKENNNRNAELGLLQATDPDTACNSLSYEITTEQSQGSKVFAIDNNGKITVLSVLDREFRSLYTAVVTVEDCGSPALQVSTRITVEVLDENDNNPKFALNNFKASVYENIAKNSVILQVTASDDDVGSNSELSYSLQSGDTNSFSINSKTGTITSKVLLDRESKDSYTLTVKASDNGSTPLTGITTVDITILDINDNKPTIKNLPRKVTVSEDRSVGHHVFGVNAEDKDFGVNADLRYYIDTGNDQNSFQLDAKTGDLTVARKPDYETRQSFTLNIRVTDRGNPPLSSFGQLEIEVTDENDNAPVFSLASYRATVRENTPQGTSFFKVSATDLDSGTNGQITYSIDKGNDGDAFSIDSTGWMKIKNSPDFESKNQYSLLIEAADNGSPPKAAYAHVTVIIEDVNDHRPQFNKSEYHFNVSEGAPVRGSIGSVYAEDRDSGPRGRVVYTIKGGDRSAFTIDGNTGAIIVLSRLDRELKSSYTLNVEARDGGSPSKASLVDVKITISDINDNKPLFDKPSYLAHVSEDASLGTSVVTVSAVDDDIGQNKEITYAIKTGNEQGTFNFDKNSGLMTLNQSLDHETKTSYQLVVTATDHGKPPLASSVGVTVMVTDVNDNPPSFAKSLYNCSVAENLAKGVAVCYVTASDPDSGLNGQLFYTIVSGDATNAFEINTATGEITTARTLDRETTSVYNLTVMAEDGKWQRSGSSLKATTTVMVHIMDENDNAPVFMSSYRFNVSEDKVSPYEIGRVTAIDEDVGQNGKVAYRILAGNSGDSFRIDSLSGSITVKSKLDRETYAQYSLIVKAADLGVPSLSSSVVVTVMIGDVNDNPPMFSQQMFYGSIREDASPGSTVVKVEASDKDEGTNGQLHFSLQGKGSENFTIDSRGFIHTNTPLDYETTAHYMLNVTATDGGFPSSSASAQVNITIVNVNDNVPVFVTSSQVSKVREDVAIGTHVIRLNATDADGKGLTFKLTSGNTGGAFKIHSSTGLITVAAKLDREKIEQYILAVKATDPDGQSVTYNATINITDVNDNAPVFKNNSYSKEIMENLQPGQPVATVSATDEDEGVNSQISYQITSGDTSKFVLNSKTGAIKTSATLDREEASSYHLVVTAKDHGTPSLSSTVDVMVKVLDENDNSPRFSSPFYKTSVLENTAVDTKVLQLTATDPDEGPNGLVTFSIISGNTNDVFVINNGTGFIAVKKNLDREVVDSYSLYVSASDNAANPKTAYVWVNFTVLDENDNSPIFKNVTNFTVTENAKAGTKVGNVYATDSDAGKNGEVRFSIVEGNDGDALQIDSVSGEISVKGGIDREKQARYTLTVKASDRGNPAMKANQKFQITVLDENDNPPKFASSVVRGAIEENKAAMKVIQVTATDKDTGANAIITYSITGGNSKSHFTIDPKNGDINTTTSLNFENTTVYNLTVTASDSKFSAYVNVIIQVVDVNDNRPSFDKLSYVASVAENSRVLTSVVTISASDPDPFGQLTYSIESTQPGNRSDAFSVDFSSGVITTADVLDRESINTYVLQVKVTDGGEPTLSGFATVTINVTDKNDNPPVFNVSSFQATIPENSDIASFVVKIQAEDADLGSNARISYFINSSNDMSAFAIDTDTGVISINKKLDRENISNYLLKCVAIDHGQPKLSSMPVAVHVTLSDVNDNAPAFLQSVYAVNVSEDVTSGTVVEEVVAVDPDAGLNGTVVYSISGGNDDDTFTIGNKTGVVTVSRALDRETRDAYLLTITASDEGNPQKSSSVKLSITVLDVNDNAPRFNASSLQGGIKENLPGGSFVMRVMATDADIGTNAQLVYNLTTKEYTDVFALNSLTGEITTQKSLDREIQDRYTLKVSARDKGDPQLTSLADVTINVIDVDDNCPKFEPAEYNLTIRENLPFNQSIVQVTATDIDLMDSKMMQYAIRSGNTRGAFTIDQYGYLRVGLGGVDREVAETYRLVIRAGREECGVNNTDNSNQNEGISEDKLASTAVVNIIVTDINDSPPRFEFPSYKFELSNLDATEIGQVKAVDDDLGSGGIVKFRLLDQTEVQGNRRVTVEAYDMGTPSLNSSVDVIIETSSDSIACEAMVFRVTEDGIIKTDTLCEFTKKPQGATRLVGQKHQLNCSAKGNTIPQYRWMKDGRFVSNWENVGDYVIEMASEDDQGGYSCLASSSAGVIQSSVAYMTVNDPPKITVHPVNSSVELDGKIKLYCNATGDPQPSFKWYKNGIAMVEASGVKPFQPELVMEDALPEDEARYYCEASNVAGKVRSNWASLKVFGKKALVSMTLTVKRPNKDGTCQIFDVKEFKKRLSEALKANVEVTGFTAPERCEEHPCNSDPCKNDGVCSRQGSKYTCLCKPGWFGDHCDQDINECTGDPCFYNGTCTNTPGSYQCNCVSTKTGKKCELEKAACNSRPCNGTDICALSERSYQGFQCVSKELETVMMLPSGAKYQSVYDLEKAIENSIKTAPNNVSVTVRRRRSEKNQLDYGACSVRVTSYKDREVRFVLLCPPDMKPEPQTAQRFVCQVMFNAGQSTECGKKDSMMTPIPPTTKPPVKPLEVKLTFFARDRESGNDLDASNVVDMINSGQAEELEQFGFKVESAKTTYAQPQTAKPESKVGLIVGLTLGLVCLFVLIAAVIFFVLKRRNKPINFHHWFKQRAVMTRLENQNSIVQRERSVKDISRSEKQYLNVAYDDESGDVSDDEGQFMVQVDLGKPRKKSPAGICSEPYFYNKTTEQEAEEMLSSMLKPGTFLVRRGESSKAFFLTVRAPEGGPSFRHLPFKYDKESSSFVAQFGSMDDSKSFQTINELVSHFQVTPIPFDEDSPDLVLTHPWNKSEV